jgi:hypothetical protein
VGYRSDVVIAIYADVFPEPDGNELSAEEWKFVQTHYRKSSISGRELAVFEFDSVKWYSDWRVVHFFEERMDELDQLINIELETEPPYAFMRLGEEPTDIQTRGDPSGFGIYVQTSISCEI